jgi:hypothetical protein
MVSACTENPVEPIEPDTVKIKLQEDNIINGVRIFYCTKEYDWAILTKSERECDNISHIIIYRVAVKENETFYFSGKKFICKKITNEYIILAYKK